MLADSVTRITKDEAVAALEAQAFRCEPGEDDYRRAVDRIRALCAGRETVGSSEIAAALDGALGNQRMLVHCLMGGFGADWDLHKAVALVREADEAGWCLPFLGHDLVVASNGRTYNFQVTRPGSSEGER